MARYDALRKLQRNKMLREYAETHPELSLKEIGQAFNISQSRVWRILHSITGLPKKEGADGRYPIALDEILP